MDRLKVMKEKIGLFFSILFGYRKSLTLSIKFVTAIDKAIDSTLTSINAITYSLLYVSIFAQL